MDPALIGPFISLVGSLTASGVALWIANRGWRNNDHRARQDKEAAVRAEQAKLLTELLELHLGALAAKQITKNDARMKAILLTLPGHLATMLRLRLNLDYTIKDVQLDMASAERLRQGEEAHAGHKWMIFDRNSVLKGRAYNHRNPYPEWVEAELAYDIAGLRGEDQDAVLRALSKDVRDPKDATIAALQENQEQRQIKPGGQ